MGTAAGLIPTMLIAGYFAKRLKRSTMHAVVAGLCFYAGMLLARAGNVARLFAVAERDFYIGILGGISAFFHFQDPCRAAGSATTLYTTAHLRVG